MKRWMRWLAVLGVMTAAAGAQAEALDPALAAEAEQSIQKGLQWLLAQQQTDGHWSNPDFPALTGLPLWALAQSGTNQQPAVNKAVQYIMDSVHEDGSIWRQPSVEAKGGGLANYNTAICMVALNRVDRPDLTPIVLMARQYMSKQQHLGDDIYKGGMGYDPATGRPYADLSNSYMAYEAMRLTENVEDLRKHGDPKANLDWDAAAQFIESVQNGKDTNDPENSGGFAYKPDGSQAGASTNAAGEIRFRSYGSMTYAGLLSFIYADVNKDDPRVASAMDWATRHWTLEENPGMGKQGLYYFYNVLAKALAVYGQTALTFPDGSKRDWRSDLIKKLLALQKTDEKTGLAYWANDEGRWWESDPVLVTSYSILALQAAVKAK
ncbi:MAG: prenyltransferase/squalene oxidase repeat-containing protein [Lentisphaerota bacterium]